VQLSVCGPNINHQRNAGWEKSGHNKPGLWPSPVANRSGKEGLRSWGVAVLFVECIIKVWDSSSSGRRVATPNQGEGGCHVRFTNYHQNGKTSRLRVSRVPSLSSYWGVLQLKVRLLDDTVSTRVHREIPLLPRHTSYRGLLYCREEILSGTTFTYVLVCII